ncbi:OmpA family protein [Microbacterium sp. NPDC096154]|uniref:OmpA family protein n=1 Tax=Microbacterium sp. NPDC096154 TaxID=3155549 RepID=UPI00332AE04A
MTGARGIIKVMTGSALALALFTGCTNQTQAEPNNGPATTPSSTASPTEIDAPVVSAGTSYEGVAIRVEVSPVEVRDGIALLRVAYVAEGDSELPALGLILRGGIFGQDGASGLRLFDSSQSLVYPVLADGTGHELATRASALLSGGKKESAFSLSVHAAPAGKTVDLLIPRLGWVRDVPVVDADESFAEDLSNLGGAPVRTEAIPLRTYMEAYDEATATRSEGETVTMTLASDVLFATGAFSLDSTAATAVDAAAAEILASADEGDVHVVGHTDDVDTPESNQTLSEKRAQAVASRMRTALGDAFTVVASGEGETNPVASGTSVEARAANRRVEISFNGVQNLKSAEAKSALPDAAEPVVAAGDQAQIRLREGDNTEFALRVASVVRDGQALIGTFELSLASGEARGAFTDAMGKPNVFSASRRGFALTAAHTGTLTVSLLTPEGRVFPFDYEVPGQGGQAVRRTLGDEVVNGGLEAVGQKTLVTVVWPDTGQDNVTIEVPGRARFIDVPVTTTGKGQR